MAWADNDANVVSHEGEEVDWSQVPQTHRFVPLGFEAGGAFGQATLDFLREVEEVAGDQSSADLYHWSAMEFGEHWLQRLSFGGLGGVCGRWQAPASGWQPAAASQRAIAHA